MEISQGMGVFTKAQLLKEKIEQSIGALSGDEVLTLMAHLDHFWLNRGKEPLTEREMVVYDLINKEGINACTAYSWLLGAKGT